MDDISRQLQIKQTRTTQLINNLYPYRIQAAPVYKFVNEEFMESFFSTGDLRLGTLNDFRNTEKHGDNRGDSTEGKNTVYQHVAYQRGTRPDSFVGQVIDAGEHGIIENCTFTLVRQWPEAYVFCTSKIFSEEGFWDWHAREGTTACYEIFDPVGFALAVEAVVKARAYAPTMGTIVYVDGDVDGATDLHQLPAPLIKQKKYAWQTEFRWFWTHRHPAISIVPRNFAVPDARTFCRRVARLEHGRIEYLWHKEMANA